MLAVALMTRPAAPRGPEPVLSQASSHGRGIRVFLDSPRALSEQGHISYSGWLMEGNPTNICSVTKRMGRLVVKHAGQQPWQNRARLRGPTRLLHSPAHPPESPAAASPVTVLLARSSLTFSKGPGKTLVFSPRVHRSSPKSCLTQFSRRVFLPFISGTVLIVELSGLHLGCIFLV